VCVLSGVLNPTVRFQLNVMFLETYSGMSSSPSVRLVVPPVSHSPVPVRPPPAVRPLSSTMPAVRVISAAGVSPAVATATSLSAVSMPTAPTLKRKRDDDDDYDLT